MLAASYPKKGISMFVQTLDELITAGRQNVFCDGALRSVRFLLKGDGMGFSMSDVRCKRKIACLAQTAAIGTANSGHLAIVKNPA
jgi:hypothetical protein